MGKRKAVFNWSGGKDSALALTKVLEGNEYEVVALLTTVDLSNRRSSMHGIPLKMLERQAGSIGIPLHPVLLSPDGGISDYEAAYGPAIEKFKSMGVEDFIFGDIFLHDVRSYREKQLAPYGINVVEPLWDMSGAQVMEQFLASGLKTIIVTTMAEVLGREYIGRQLDRKLVASLPEGTDQCGENGEYHTLCFDGPLFREPVDFILGEPFIYKKQVGMDDGSIKEFSYWTANISE